MARLIALIFLLGWVSSFAEANNCPCIDFKIWLDDTFGFTPNIDLVNAKIQDNIDNGVTTYQHWICLSKFWMEHDESLELFISKMNTFFIAPETGTYTFWLTCDNACILFLKGIEVLRLNQFAKKKSLWDTYPANQTVTVELTKGDCCEVSATHAEGVKADFLGVGVTYPSGTEDIPMSQHMCIECPCNPSPCDEGACVPTGNYPDGHECDCDPCYEGELCDTAIDACSANPCKNGGTCNSNTNGDDNCYSCDCPDCWTGKDCEILIDACSSNPCENGGTCTSDANESDCYSCSCPLCWEGKDCEIPRDTCHNEMCKNGGECKFDDSMPSCHRCDCLPCFSGKRCDKLPCDDDICPEGSKCFNKPDTENCYECKTGCFDEDDDCEDRCKNIGSLSHGQFKSLAKNCRKTCDFCCPCEAGCNVMYQKRGCWDDKSGDKRTLPNLLITDRDKKSPKYQGQFPGWAQWYKYVPDFTCRCAKAALDKGYKYFAIQFYQECWAGNEFNPKFGQGERCIDRQWNKCTWTGRAEEQIPNYCCAGKNSCNYVYEIPYLKEVDKCSF